MKCAKCNTEVSIADSRCKKCGQDLLQFDSTVFYERKAKDSFDTLGSYEQKMVATVKNRLKTLFQRHIPEERLEDYFDREVLPAVDDLSKDRANEEVLLEIEKKIREKLEAPAYNHYSSKGQDVLRILRAGELALLLMEDKIADMDLSVKMFSYFKASEKSCRLHTRARYQELRDDPLIREISEGLGRNDDSLSIDNIPEWLIHRKKTLIEVINGVLTENDYYLGGSLRTGIAIYVLGRTWGMKVRRADLSKEKTFQIKNLLRAYGSDSEKEALAGRLQELQRLRNERMHTDIEGDEKAVKQSRGLAYECLRGISGALNI